MQTIAVEPIPGRTPIPPFELAENLPVSGKADEIAEAIRRNRVVIVCGETGSGKTTQLPKICLAAGRGRRGMIAHTQPRRIAASSVAKRIAQELKTGLGEVVGYKVRFTDHTERGATIKLMTDGILLAETLSDPQLRAYDTVIIDEAHERSLNIDFLMGYLKCLMRRRRDLKLIITSATIDAERFAEHFGEPGHPAPVISVSGRTYPVEIRWRPVETDKDETDDKDAMQAVCDAVDELEMAGRGDILCFFPGEREIREASEALRRSHRPGQVEILPLFARLTAEEQERIFRPTASLRRIVLATNIAETSLTVPGIRYVVDTGFARVKRYSYRNKVEQLQIEPISQAAANQRAGRCGRVANGICIRLYSEQDWDRRDKYTDPEILRSSLASVILRMRALRLGDIREFPFVDAPLPKAVADGIALLEELNAIDGEGELTGVGRVLSHLPLDPRIGRMLLAGRDRDALEEVLIIASALSVQDPRERPLDAQEAADQAHKRFANPKSDFLTWVNLWRAVEKMDREKASNRRFDEQLRHLFLSPRRLREWRDVYRQIRSMLSEEKWRFNDKPATEEMVHRSLLAGLLGNVGFRQLDADFRAPPFVGARGIKFFIWPGSVLAKKAGRWVMAAELVETSRLFARCVADIEPEWIEEAAAHLIRKSWTEPHWEKKQARVMAFERGALYGMTVYQQRRVSFASKDPKTARELLIREGLVADEWEGNEPFMQHNRRLVREIQELEHKTRRPDVLVDDELIYAFYDSKIPAEAVSGRAFDAWRREAEKKEPKLLFLKREELMRHDASGVTTEYFPKKLDIAGISMALTYHFEPGSPRDGVTLAVPLFALNKVDPVRCEWLVPGMLKEKVHLLIKSLPQRYRRHCVPIPAWAQDFAQRHESVQQGPLIDAIIADLREQFGFSCLREDFKQEQLPAHLVMNFKVLDEHGRQVGMDRNLAVLRSEFGAQAREDFMELAAGDAAVSEGLQENITEWSFGELPELLEIRRKGESVIGIPALVDKGESCAIEVFDDPQDAAKAHRDGLRRLFAIKLKKQIKFLVSLHGVQLQAQTVPVIAAACGDGDELKADLVAAALDQTALLEPLPKNREEFEARLEETRTKMTLIAQEIARLLSAIAAEAGPIPKKLAALRSFPDAVKDVEGQMQRLFPKHFMRVVPFAQLKHYPRYMKAIAQRLERLRNDPARDAQRMADIVRLQVPWLRELASRKGVEDQTLTEFRWLLEELRVSLFAQELRTPMPVSVKRLTKVWESSRR